MVDRIGIDEQHVKETVQEKFSIQIKNQIAHIKTNSKWQVILFVLIKK